MDACSLEHLSKSRLKCAVKSTAEGTRDMASSGMLSRYKRKKAPPEGWEEVQQVMDALEEEMKKG